MGSFEGHALPGSFFIVFGIWWTTQIARLKIERNKNRERKVRHENFRTVFPCTCFGYKLPLEAFLKVFFTFFGICIEINSSLQSEAVSAPDNQHIVMYLMFLINSLCEIFTYYKILVPKGTDYFTGFLAFLVEGMLFLFHVEHQENFERTIHVLLIFVIFLCCVTTIFEGKNPDNINFKYVRAFFTILQGTWFYQIGFFIYNPLPGWPKVWHAHMAHAQNMWVSVIFSWHCIAILTFQLAIICITWFVRNGCVFRNLKYSKIHNGHDLPLINQKTVSTECLDEDDEYFFQDQKMVMNS